MARSSDPSEVRALLKRHNRSVAFDHGEMDFYFLLALSLTAVGGGAVGECFHAASLIEEGSPDSWRDTFTDLGERVREQADLSLAAGHHVSAREAYLSAFNYFRWAEHAMAPGAECTDGYLRARESFRAAAALFSPPIETFTVPFEGAELSGYFVAPPGPTGEPRPTLIMAGGAEMMAEELYFWAGLPARRRGWNAVLIDLPGQGGAIRLHGLTFRPDTEVPVAAIVDALVQRADVDPDRLALCGMSAGGYFVTRAVVHEHRIAAVIANCPITDVERAFASRLGDDGAAFAAAFGTLDGFTQRNVERVLWYLGCADPAEFVASWHDFSIVGQERDITCPVLSLVSTGDGEEAIRQTTEFHEALPSPLKRMRIFTPEEGADAHCQGNNPRLQHAAVFDWLEETLGAAPLAAPAS